TYRTSCNDPVQVPYYEDFESYPYDPSRIAAGTAVRRDYPYNDAYGYIPSTQSLLPECWRFFPEPSTIGNWDGANATTKHQSVPKYWLTQGDIHYSGNTLALATGGTNNAGTWSATQANARPIYAVLPLMDEPLCRLNIAFKYRYYGSGVGQTQVGYCTTPENPAATFVSMQGLTNTATGYTDLNFNYGAKGLCDTTQDYYIVIKHWYTGDNGWNSNTTVYIDNLSITRDACLRPLICQAPQVIGDSVTISWMGNEDAVGYSVKVSRGIYESYYYRVGADVRSITIGGLSSQQDYDVEIRSFCSANDSSVASTTSFTSPCGAVALPYTENFEECLTTATGSYYNTSGTYAFNNAATQKPNCWNFYMPNPGTYNNANAGYVFFTTNTYHTGARGMGLHTYAIGTQALAAMPRFAVAGQDLKLSFWNRSYNASYGTQTWGVMTDPTDYTTYIPCGTVTKSTTYTEYGPVDVATLLPESVRLDTVGNHYYWIAFRELATHINQPATTFFIDDINVDVVDNICRQPQVMNVYPEEESVKISWSVVRPFAKSFTIAYSSDTAEFDINNPLTYQTATFEVPQAGETLDTFELTLTGLTAGTYYRFAIMGHCGERGNSIFSDTTHFVTLGDEPEIAECKVTDLSVSNFTSSAAYFTLSNPNLYTDWQVAYGLRRTMDVNDPATYTLLDKSLDATDPVIFTVSPLMADSMYRFAIRGKLGDDSYCEWSNYTSVTLKNDNTDITSYSINDYAGVIDHEAHTVTVTLPFGTDFSALTSVFTLGNAKSMMKLADALQESGVTANSWAEVADSVLTFTVYAEDEAVHQDWNVYLRIEGCVLPTDLSLDFVGRRRLTFEWEQPDGDKAHDFVLSTTPLDNDQLEAAEKRVVAEGINTFDTIGLARDTRYYAYLRTNCGADGVSGWLNIMAKTDDTLACLDAVWSNPSGTGTNTTNVSPVNYQKKGYSQLLYKSGNIYNVGANTAHGAGWITAIDVNQYQTDFYKEITMWMGNTANTTLAAGGSNNWYSVNAMEQVVAPRLQHFVPRNTSSDKWVTIQLDHPFYYSGQSLVIAVVNNYTGRFERMPSDGSSSTAFGYLTGGTNQRRYYGSNTLSTTEITFDNNGQPWDNGALIADGNSPGYMLNMKFKFCPSPDICPSATSLTATLDGDKPSEKVMLDWAFDTADYFGGFELLVSTTPIANPTAVFNAHAEDKTTGDTLVYHIAPNSDAPNTAFAKQLENLRHSRTYYVYLRTNCQGDPDSNRSGWQNITFRTASECLPVSNLKTTIASKSRLFAQWDRPNLTQANNYLYRISTTPLDKDTLKLVDTTGTFRGNNNGYIDGLQCNTTYYLYVAAYCTDDDISEWVEATPVTMPECCIKPTGLTVTTTSSTATLSWNSGQYGDESQWEVIAVYGNVADSQDNALVRVCNSRTYTFTDLKPNTTYRFHLRSLCGSNYYSEYVTPVQKRTLDTVAYFTAYSITIGTATTPVYTGVIDQNHQTIDVSVPYGTNLSSVKATFTLSGTAAVAKVGSTTQTSASTLNNFSRGPLTYSLFAEDINYVHNWTVNVHYAGCATPTNLTLTAVPGTARALDITWTQPDNTITDHDLIISPTAVANPDLYRGSMIYLTDGATSYRATGLAKGITYYVYVRANCGAYASEWVSKSL
ncbi:MAG: fibronectin type III domain-containing protein, partial [Bacteroidales bacterium]|nr:fibronectin type III domain-containing protein [Candidatus Colimorpha onthohippi]